MYVYGEEVFIINFIMDLTLAVFVMKISGKKMNILRCALSAATGGIYSVISLYINTTIFHSIIISAIMARIISGNDNELTVRSAVFLFIFSVMSGGGILLLLESFPELKGNMLFMLAGSLLSVTVCISAGKNLYNGAKIISGTYKATITHREKNYSLRLFNDTGNLITTPSGESVVVVGENIFTRIFGDIHNTDNFRNGISFVNAGTITGEKVFFIIKADKLYIPSEGYIVSPVYITSADINTDRFDGIINLNLTGGKYVQENNS